MAQSQPNAIFDLMIEAEMINADRHWNKKRRLPLLLLMIYLRLRSPRPVFKIKEVEDES